MSARKTQLKTRPRRKVRISGGSRTSYDRLTDKTEPTNNPELGVVIDVVVQNCRGQRAEFTHSGTETVCGRSDGDGEHFGGDEEGGAVGTELLEESGQEVDCLEAVDMGGFSEVVVCACGDQL